MKSRDTTPEKLLRRALRKAKISYRTCDSNLPGKPDIVISSRRIAVFVDGDFWHGRQWASRKHASLEGQFTGSASRDYWLAKIRRTIGRDLTNTAALLASGWKVARFWETDVIRDPQRCIEVLAAPSRPDARSLIPQRTVAEFFAGIGLMRYAFEGQGWRVAYANDIDPKKLDMYAGHFGDRFHLGDVNEIDPASVPSVSLATASLAGRHSSALRGFLRVLEGLGDRRPPLVLIETKPGLLTSAAGKDLHAVLRSLNAIGYAADIFTLDTIHFVPQSRNRLFIIGQPAGGTEGERPARLSSFIERHPDIHWTLRRLPEPPERTLTLREIIDSDAEWWDADRSASLLSQIHGSCRATADEIIRKRRWTYGAIFRRVRDGRTVVELQPDACPRTPRGGRARQIVFRAGYGRYSCRFLTGRECARLLGAGDYHLDGSPNQAQYGFDDAVCVPAIEWIITHYLTPLSNELIRGFVLIR